MIFLRGNLKMAFDMRQIFLLFFLIVNSNSVSANNSAHCNQIFKDISAVSTCIGVLSLNSIQ